MNVWKIFDTIEEAVSSSQRLPGPFSKFSLINRHNFMRLMDKMRSSVSPELKQARAVSKDVQRLLTEAQEQAEQILKEARDKAKAQIDSARAERENIINSTEVLQTARKRAEELEAEAQARCEELEVETRNRCLELRKQAEEYAKDVKRKASDEASSHEAEIERYAVKLLSRMEVDIDRALQIVRSNKESLQSRNESQEDEDTLTLEPEKVQKVLVTAAAGARKTA